MAFLGEFDDFQGEARILRAQGGDVGQQDGLLMRPRSCRTGAGFCQKSGTALDITLRRHTCLRMRRGLARPPELARVIATIGHDELVVITVIDDVQALIRPGELGT